MFIVVTRRIIRYLSRCTAYVTSSIASVIVCMCSFVGNFFAVLTGANMPMVFAVLRPFGGKSMLVLECDRQYDCGCGADRYSFRLAFLVFQLFSSLTFTRKGGENGTATIKFINALR